MAAKKATPKSPDRHSGRQTQFRLPDELVDAVDRRLAAVNEKRILKLTRSDVVRALLHSWAEGRVKVPELS